MADKNSLSYLSLSEGPLTYTHMRIISRALLTLYNRIFQEWKVREVEEEEVDGCSLATHWLQCFSIHLVLNEKFHPVQHITHHLYHHKNFRVTNY